MEREVFVARFREATAGARDFARTMIIEALPDPLVFRLRLNSSYDGHPAVEDEQRFPDDGSFELAVELSSCEEERAIATLWRDGRVPEWINATVVGETGGATVVELTCCGRFTALDRLLYHEREGHPPFHVLGPAFPASHSMHGPHPPFSIYDRSECWTRAELDRVGGHASRVCLLDLVGHAFDDAALGTLPRLPNLEVITLSHSPINGRGLAALSRFPKLRALTVELDQVETFQLDDLDAVKLESLTLTSMPAHELGLARLLARSPNLTTLTIRATEAVLEGSWPQVASVVIEARRVRGTVRLPAKLDAVSLSVAEMDDVQIAELLAPVRELRHLHLDGTRITDELAAALVERYALNSFGVVRTQVTDTALAQIASAHPKLRLRPRRR